MTYIDQEWQRLDDTWHAEGSQAPVQHAALLACIVLVLPVALVAVAAVGLARDVLRAITKGTSK